MRDTWDLIDLKLGAFVRGQLLLILRTVEDALAAEELSLSNEEIARLEEPYVPHEVSGIDL